MRVTQATLLLALVGSAQAFTTVAPFGVTAKAGQPLFMAAMADARTAIGGLTKDNFSATLTTIEPFLLNEAGGTFYTKSMKRIAVKAKAVGAEVPAGYAKAAAATLKKREKQDAFIKVKEEGRAAAEEEAAAAAVAAEAAAVEAAAAAVAEAEAAAAAAAATPEEPEAAPEVEA
jgi:hypothetical protein